MKQLRCRPSLALGAAWLLAGCNGCRDEKPYTPFGVTSALPPAPPSAGAPAAPASAAAPELSVKKAVLTPPGARRFRVGEREIEAPAKRVFEQALSLPLPGEATPLAVAWTLPDPEDTQAEAAGELWLYPGSGEPRRILEFPAFLPTGAGCRYATSVASASETLLFVDVQATCSEALLARVPTRALVIVDPSAARPVRFGLRASAPAAGENLTLELVARDEDADGRGDFRLDAGLALGKAAPLAHASFVWLDRAAGVSRDAREPSRALADALAKELPRAQRKKTAAAALERVDATRRLLGALCAEGATPRVFDWDGSPLPCGGLSNVVDRLANVELAAHFALSDVVAGAAVLARDGWYFAPLSAAQKKALTQEVEKKLTPVPAARISLGVRPRSSRPGSPSPLAFEPSGALLIQSDSGLYRLGVEGAREARVEPDAGIEAWPLALTLQGGAEVIAVSYSCDRSEVALLTSAGAAHPLSVLAPRPGMCGGRGFEDRFPPTPVAIGESPTLLVGGRPSALLEQKTASTALSGSPGSARSPDGQWLAVPTPLGLLIAGATHQLWKTDGWDGATIAGCVVSNGAERAACVRGGRAELYLKNTTVP